MEITLRIIGTDGIEIRDLDDWFEHAPPAGGIDQWVDCYSAKEQAKSWLRPGHPAVPEEVARPVEQAGFGGLSTWTAYPEHETKLDTYSRGAYGLRHHDMLVLLGDPDAPAAVLGIEAKACEDFDGLVSDRTSIPPPSKRPRRCNAMAQALFARPVCDEERLVVIDEGLGAHGYQLWTGSVGTLREAQTHSASDALFLVQQFEPGEEPCPANDKRDWETKLRLNKTLFSEFTSALRALPATSFETEFVEAGRLLHVLAVRSQMVPPA